jgi:AcrR family transcriptional regulator
MHQHILDVAAKLFYKNGLRAVGVDRIIAEAGIAKATLYRHFRTKEELIVAYLEARHLESLARLEKEIEAAGDDRLARACAPFEALEKKISGNFHGCAFLRAVAEHEDLPAIRRAVILYKDGVRELFHVAIAGGPAVGGKTGAVDEAENTRNRDLGNSLALLYDGALATVMVRRHGAGARIARDCAAALVTLALPERKKPARRKTAAP